MKKPKCNKCEQELCDKCYQTDIDMCPDCMPSIRVLLSEILKSLQDIAWDVDEIRKKES